MPMVIFGLAMTFPIWFFGKEKKTNLNTFLWLTEPSRFTIFFKTETGFSGFLQMPLACIYFQKERDGLYKIENGRAKLVSNDSLFQTNLIVNIFDFQSGILIQTQENGFYILDQNQVYKWEIKANDVLSDLSVYSSIKLKNETYVIGTISNGIIHLTKEGNINYQFNYSSGISNNTVLSLFEDIDNNIWLGLDNGINCINITSPFTLYNDKKGELGTVYCSIIYNNILYLGTNQGLFYKAYNSSNDFKFVEGTKGQVWSLKEIRGTLFCGHNFGTFIVNEGDANLIVDVQGTWNLQELENNPDFLIQGNFDGLYILERTESNSWQLRNKLEGFDISSRYFENSNKYEILVSHEYKGVFKLQFNDDYTRVTNVVKDTSVDKGFNSSLIKYNSQILYTYKEGVFKYNTKQGVFEKDSILTKVFEDQDYISGKLVTDKHTNKLWGFSDNGLNYIIPGKLSEIPKINRISLPQSLRKSMAGFENISFLENQKYLLGTSSGYIIIDLDRLHEKDFEISINSITVNTLNTKTELLDASVFGEFENSQNNLQFSFSVPEYDKFAEVEYQYLLDGFYDNWSKWSSNSNELFKNLPYGNYTFKVKARVGYTETTNVATYSFTIQKPWYLNNFMIALYVLIIILFSILMHNIYKRYYKKQRERILKKTEQELELKKLENKQQKMSFENEKLQQDIENKNRELAISTMSLIKKNEFLNNIKNELKQVEESKNLKPVIKIIDKNLNNTDDWKLFQEAFNNADKDFLKKVKSKHPKLTPNDLRLCAYLRLNLSSKEIAPLLNISSRSVEVKRYRLRKKMELPHEASLTNYILEL